MLRARVLILAAAMLYTGNKGFSQEVIADKIVAVVGNSAILYSEVNEMSKEILQKRREQGFTLDRDARSEALENLMRQKLLYNQAQIDSIEINKDGIQQHVQSTIDNMIKEKGSRAALEAHHHKPVFSISDDLQIKFEEMFYAQEMESTIRQKVKITPGEVEKFYKNTPKDSLPLIPDQYIYAQITKFPSSTADAKQRVKERLLELRERILNGTKFELLARMYSTDTNSAIRGGEMDPMSKESFVKPFSEALVKLKPGQVSEVVETEFGFHIIQLIDKTDDNLFKCRHILMKPIFSDDEVSDTAGTLDSLVVVIREGKLTFEAAAEEHSDDMYSKFNGGLASNHDILEMYQANDPKLTTTKFLKEELQKEDYMALGNLKKGEVSNAYITRDYKGNMMAKVVKLIDIIPAHHASLEDDYLRLEEVALDKKQNEEFRKWLDKKIEGMYIRIDPEFKAEDFENKVWFK